MKVIAVNGVSHSGKTTVCEALIGALSQRGYRVGSVKEIHYDAFRIDPDPDTNTNRHRRAGATLVTARAGQETDVMFPEKLPIGEILALYDHDYVILEGVTDCNAPRILTAHSVQELDERMDGRVVAVSGVIAETLRDYRGLPVFNARTDAQALADFVEQAAQEPLPDFDPDCCTACGTSCRGLAERVAQGQASVDACVLRGAQVELTVGGRPFPMVPFVQKLLRNAVLAVASELDGVRQGELVVRFRL